MKVRIKGYVIYLKRDWEKTGEFVIGFTDMSCAGPDYTLVQEQDFEIDVPDNFDPTPQQIAALKEKKEELRAEMQLKLNNIDEQIQKLLSLEHKQ